MTKLQDIKDEFANYIAMKDKWILDVIMHVHIGNSFIKREPIWTMIVAPSSGGKSTFLAPSIGIPIVHFLDDMTPNTLLSGFKGGKGGQTSLLNSIGSGILCFSDFTAILSKNEQAGGEIMGQLRLVYDGVFIKVTGTGKLKWEGKMGLLAAATPDVYSKLEEVRSMGERFGYYCMEQPTDDIIARKQSSVNMSSKDITKLMSPLYGDYFKGMADWVKLNGVPDLNMTDAQRERLWTATMFSVAAKSTVHVGFKTGKVDRIPNKAGVGRDNKMSQSSLHTYQLMDCYENDNKDLPLSDDRMALIEKQAYSSVSRERRKILEILANETNKLQASEVGVRRGLGMEKDAVELYLTPLHAVGLIQKSVQSGYGHTWYIADQNTKDFIKRVSVGIDDYIPQSNDNIESEISVVLDDIFGGTEF